MAVLLGLAAALGFGSADFLGGHASKRSSALSVLLLVQAVGLPLGALWVALDGAPFPAGGEVAAGIGAGAFGATGLGLFFRGLAIGRMGAVAPLSAVVTAVIPVSWGVLRGERPSGAAAAGVVLAVVAVLLVSSAPDREGRGSPGGTRSLVLGALSGVAFGVAVTLFAESAEGGAFWPLVLSRSTALTGLVVVVASTGRAWLPAPADRRGVIASGALDLIGNAALLEAFRRGLTSLVSPVAALYPAATVVLARLVLAEHMSRMQAVGVGLALVGLVLIGAG